MSLEDLSPQQRANLAAMELLMSNPDVALATKKLIKQLKPETRFADLEVHEQIAASTAALAKKQEAIEEALNKDRLERLQAEERQKTRAAGIDVEQLEAFMKENELYSYSKARKIFAQVNRPAAPTPARSLVVDMAATDQDLVKNFWKDPVKTARAEAEAFFKERAQPHA